MKSCISLVLFFAFFAAALSGQNPTAREVVDLMDKAMLPDSFEMQFSLASTAPGKSATGMAIISLHKNNTGTIMEITRPERSRGTRFLERDASLWMYSPRSGSGAAIRLSPRSSFQGSAFSNNDFTDPRFADDYEPAFLPDENVTLAELGRVLCHVVEGIAKSERTTYARIKFWCVQGSYLPVKIEYYTKSGLLFKRMEFSGFRDLAGRVRPSIYTMTSLEETGTVSTVTIERLVARNDLRDADFTQAALSQ